MASRSLTLDQVRSRLKTFEEPIVSGIINRHHLKNQKGNIAVTPVLDYEANQIHMETQIQVDMDQEIMESYLKRILPMITGETENEFFVQDQLLLDLICCRVYYGKEIAEIKFRDTTAIFLEHYRNRFPIMSLIDNPEIEYTVLKRAKNHEKLTHGSNLSHQVESIFAEMISLNKRLQVKYIQMRIQNLKIGYLGPEGTFASQLSRHYFKGLKNLHGGESHRELFQMLDHNHLDIIVVPARNNITGLVPGVDVNREKHYLVKMIDFKVVVDLLGREQYPLDEVEVIYSHPQTLAEAQSWIGENLPDAKIVRTKSTASASRNVKEDTHRKGVALSSRRCAEKLGLTVLQENVVDNSVTTFFIVARR